MTRKEPFFIPIYWICKDKESETKSERNNRILKKMKVMLDILEIKTVFLKYCML